MENKVEAYRKLEDQVAEEINELTIKYIRSLGEKWMETFEMKCCEDNLRKLPEHVAIFYSEIESETTERINTILCKIQKLQEEANELRRLLKVDITLSPPEGVPLYTAKIILDENLDELREILKERRRQIEELLEEEKILCEELGEPPKKLSSDPLPTADELDDFRLYLESLKAEKINRQYKVANLKRDIKSFLNQLELQIQNEEEKRFLNDCDLPPTKMNINRLEELREEYAKQIDEIRESVEKMKQKLTVLWTCLDISPTIREKFQKYTDYSQTTYDKIYEELNRCESLKRQNIQKIIDKIRAEIVIWWDKTLKSDLERSRFSNFTNDCYTEDLLILHEMELEDLKRFYHENEPIFNLISERKILWDRMLALEAKASEPGRYNNRGGQLLKEEKERKMIANKLPKIEAQLTELVHKYEEEHNRKFLVYGENILEVIASDWQRKQSEKEKVMSARKYAPSSLSKTRTPLSVKNHQITSSMKKLPSSSKMYSNNLSKKRRRSNTEPTYPAAKRNLIDDFEPSKHQFLIPPSSLRAPTPIKAPAPVKAPTPFKTRSGNKPRLIATTINRRSGRLSGSNKNRRKSGKSPRKLHKMTVTAENSEDTEPSVSYELFEEHICKDPGSRSSIAVQTKLRAKKQYEGAGITSASLRRDNHLPNPRLMKTPSKTNIVDQFSTLKSPGISRAGTPIPGGSKRKLTSKNLPVII